MVRVILVEVTTPFRMRPRIDTLPVKGHFLSMYVPCRTELNEVNDKVEYHARPSVCMALCQQRQQNALQVRATASRKR
jgi:hypothetical protein